MHTARLTLFIAAALFAAAPHAQVLEQPVVTPITQQGMDLQALPRPRGGMSMAQVEARYGAPVKKFDAVGEPPISRWVYDNYTVYFEHNLVIHTVLNKK